MYDTESKVDMTVVDSRIRRYLTGWKPAGFLGVSFTKARHASSLVQSQPRFIGRMGAGPIHSLY